MIGRVLGEALAALRGRGVVVLGMIVAALGLLYAAVPIWLQSYNPQYLTDLSETLTTQLPPDFGLWTAGGLAVLLIGGLLGEAGVIRAAGRRVAAQGGAPLAAGGVLRCLPGLIVVAVLIWWPVLVFGGAIWAYYAPTSVDSLTDSANGGILVLICCLPVFLVIGAFLFWPLHRLANCALVLDGVGPLLAVRVAWRLFWGRFGTVVGLWLALLALNGLLLLISILLAGLAAALVYAVWGVLNGPSEGTALGLIAVVAGLLGLGLLFWDGVITAFNLGTWVLAFRELTGGGPKLGDDPDPLPVSAAGSTQLLGRSRQ